MKRENKPWGHYVVLFKGNGYQLKRIEIKPGLRFSLQKHSERAETWVILSGRGTATLGKKTVSVRRGRVLHVGVRQAHRMHNRDKKKPLVFIEVQLGKYLGEDDVVRLQDDFNRVTKGSRAGKQS